MHGSSTHAALGMIVAGLALAALASQRRVEPALPAPAPARESARPALRALRDGQEIELNRAGTDELILLPGVGPKLAQRIVEERDRRGGFARVEDLLPVRGMGPKTLEQVRPFLRVSALKTDRADTTAKRPP